MNVKRKKGFLDQQKKLAKTSHNNIADADAMSDAQRKALNKWLRSHPSHYFSLKASSPHAETNIPVWIPADMDGVFSLQEIMTQGVFLAPGNITDPDLVGFPFWAGQYPGVLYFNSGEKDTPDLQLFTGGLVCNGCGQNHVAESVVSTNGFKLIRDFVDSRIVDSLPSVLKPLVYSANKTDDFIEWYGLYCRSQPEQSIAQELETRGLSFLVNAGGRFNLNGDRVTREPDFLVFLGNGKSAILEVDGEAFHQSAAKDHERDRVFRRLGVPVERFTAKQCTNNPSAVVSEFLTLVTAS